MKKKKQQKYQPMCDMRVYMRLVWLHNKKKIKTMCMVFFYSPRDKPIFNKNPNRF